MAAYTSCTQVHPYRRVHYAARIIPGVHRDKLDDEARGRKEGPRRRTEKRKMIKQQPGPKGWITNNRRRTCKQFKGCVEKWF